MPMRVLISALCILFAVLCGCEGKKDSQEKGGRGAQKPAIETEKNDGRMVGVVKKAVFDVNKTKPVGKAIDDYRYFTMRDWRETDAQNGTIYVDFIGGLDPKVIDAGLKKGGVVARAINVKFVVKPDGTCFVGMITLYDTKTDGKISPIPVTAVAEVMNAIYANTELPL
jgi:hypothetical protein